LKTAKRAAFAGRSQGDLHYSGRRALALTEVSNMISLFFDAAVSGEYDLTPLVLQAKAIACRLAMGLMGVEYCTHGPVFEARRRRQ